MAKFTPSSLITAIQGKFNTDAFQLWKTGICRRRITKPYHASKESRSRFKGIASDISGKWDALSQSDKDNWDALASELPIHLSGFNVFMRCNTALVYADHPALCYYSAVATSYFVPPTPSPVFVSWNAGSELFVISWTTPANASQFVQVFFAPQAGFSNLKFPKLRLGSTEYSGAQYTTVSGSGYPSGTVFRFQCRTIDKYGMVSAFSEVKSETID